MMSRRRPRNEARHPVQRIFVGELQRHLADEGRCWPCEEVRRVHPDHEWLDERMLQHRKVALSGTLDREASSRVAAALVHLDATGDEPVTLWLSSLTADLDAAFTLVDTLEQMRVPVHATCVGTLTGAAIVVLAVADRRAAGPSAIMHLCDPTPTGTDTALDPRAHARQHAQRLQRLHERIAAACGRDGDTVARDMHDERLLDAEQARAYGLVDATIGG
jgi:ATP-dependent Clp protease protease subunit